MKSYDTSRVLFYAVVILSIAIVAFGYGFYSASSKNKLYSFVNQVKNDIQAVLGEKDNLTKSRPKDFLQRARHQGSGVTLNTFGDDPSELIFLSGFFDDNNEMRLIRMNGEIVARWVVKFSEIFTDTSYLRNPPATDWNVDLHGALLLPDGSVVFNFEYKGFVKLDRCGKVVWKIKTLAHHSIDIADDGGFWVPGRRHHDKNKPSPFPPFTPPYEDDTILKISADGKIESEISVAQLFYENGLSALLTSTGEFISPKHRWDRELVHLNKITELKKTIADDFPQFQAGDLMLSLRQYNMLLIVDPHTHKIKWWQIGPWQRQHDPEFIAGGKIILFNNNIYMDAFDSDLKWTPKLNTPRISNIMETNPLTGENRSIYGGREQQQLLSVIRGKVESTPRHGLLITEFEAGRVIETDADGKLLWEYINRYSENEVAELTEARLYLAKDLRVKDWSCPASD